MFLLIDNILHQENLIKHTFTVNTLTLVTYDTII